MEGQWQKEVIQGEQPDLASSEEVEQETDKREGPVLAIALLLPRDPSQEQARESPLPLQLSTQEETVSPQETVINTEVQRALETSFAQSQGDQLSCPSARRAESGRRGSSLTIEQAIQEYLEEQRKSGRRSKTLEWHQMALSLFQEYLVSYLSVD